MDETTSNGGFDWGNFLNGAGTFLGNVAGTFATDYSRRLAYGEDNAAAIELQEERNRYNSLNGSGAIDPRLARQGGMLDNLRSFLFRSAQNPGSVQDPTPSGQGQMMITVGVIILVIVGAILLVRR